MTITDAPIANAGTDQIVCASNGIIKLYGMVNNAVGGLWNTSGDDIFNPSNTSLNAVYIAGTMDKRNGNVKLILSSTGNNSCHLLSDVMIVTFMTGPLVDAGPDRLVLENYSIILELVISGTNLQYLWLPALYLDDNTKKIPK